MVREARSRAQLTQAALASLSGTSQSTLAAYESGAKSPSARTLDRIVRAAGFSLEIFLRPAPAARGALLADLRHESDRIMISARHHGIRNVRVFGSAARGEETPHSDIDLLVDFDAVRRGIVPLAGFAHDVEEIMGRSVDVTTVQLLRDRVRSRALREAVPL